LARRRLARWRVYEPLTVFSVIEHPAMIVWPCRMRGVSAAPVLTGDGALAPGCLIGE